MRRALLQGCTWLRSNSNTPDLALGAEPVTRAILRTLCSSSQRSAPSAGLFGHEQLTSSAAWANVATDAIERCGELAAKIHVCPPGRELLHLVDEISDVVCCATDAANFCQVVHTDARWKHEALQASRRLNAYVAVLNTDSVLFEGLQRTMQQAPSAPGQGWTAEDIKVGHSLMHEFRQAGMGLTEDVQRKSRELVGQEQHLCQLLMQFEMQGSTDAVPVALSRAAAERLQLTRSNGQPRFSSATPGALTCISIPPIQGDALLAHLTLSQDRRPVYQAMHSLPDSILGSIVELAAVRRDIATLVSAHSYSDYRLRGNSLANDTAAVSHFLECRTAAALPRALDDVRGLEKWLRRHQGGLGAESARASSSTPQSPASGASSIDAGVAVGAWDRMYAARGILAEHAAVNSASTPKFTVAGALRGLFDVVQAVFGVTFEGVDLPPSEAWAPGVEKLRAVHADRGDLGTVYLDLYSRQGKYNGNAHFTIQCGRLQRDGSYRLPIVALACTFPRSRDEGITFSQVETMFHEFGHALNSVLCDNKLQHMFGARGPLDTVEVPSHLLERFCRHPAVLDLLLSHSGVSSPLERSRAAQDILFLEDFCSGISQLQRLVMPRFDGALHGTAPPGTVDALRRVTHDALSSTLPFAIPEGSCEHISLNHVASYAGLCHAYPYATDIAESVWAAKFEHSPFDAAAGAQLAETLYRPGGVVDAVTALNQIAPGLLQPHGDGFFPASNR